MTRKIRTYSEMMLLSTFEDRFDYLKLGGAVGVDTFGADRIFGQAFYHSTEWKRIRDSVIVRDNGCDLAVPDREIHSKIIIHHMNPISIADLDEGNPDIFNPEFLVCVTNNTHQAIHYGDTYLLAEKPKERRPNDTCPWR